MARVFTTTFQYKGSTYTAIVTQVDGSLYIRVSDPTFQEIFPVGELTYHHEQGLKVEAQGLSDSQDLMVEVLAAIEGKVQLRPNPSTVSPQQSL